MNKRERLERSIAGETVDRPAVALWRHFPGDDQRPADLAQSLVDFQRHYDWDFLVAMPANTYTVTGYGLQDAWQGANLGQREVVKTVVQRSLHWTELRPIDPMRGDIAKQVEMLRLLGDAFAADVPFLAVVYSPLTQARQLAGENNLLRSMRQQPDRLKTGLNTLTETTLRFVDALRRNTKVSGIFYSTDYACYEKLAEAEYKLFGLPYDQKILESLPKDWWFNLLQVNGQAPMLPLFARLPIQALNWSDQEARPKLERALNDLPFRGAFCGGLAEYQHLLLGTPSAIRDAARQALYDMGRKRLILTSGQSVPINAPLSNLRATRDVVKPVIT